jgi:hypothetical protein
MAKILTLQEIETRQQQLAEENQADRIALVLGLMDRSEVTERTLRREMEQRWLEMEALLLKGPRPNILH